MNIQLLLLLALVGPFCAFTRASPTADPTSIDVGVTEIVADITHEATEAPKEELTVVTDLPATEPGTAAQEEVATVHEEVETEAVTEVPPAPATENTEELIVETEAPVAATEAPAPLITEPPVVETEAPTEAAESGVEPVATAAAESDLVDDVVIEGETEEGLSSGQVVGIVIGALLAVVIVIAVVIAVVRRMGKYSSAKNKKPAKKDSKMVSPLRKKPAKQQEHPKFWKF